MRLAVVSVETPDIERLQQLLNQVRGQLKRPWLWGGNEAEADVLVIDVDSLYGHMDWLRAHGQGRKVVCLTGRPGNEHDITLARPITPQGLLNALRRFDQPEATAAAEAGPVAVVTPVPEGAPEMDVPVPEETPAAAVSPAPAPVPAAPAPAAPAKPAAASQPTPRATPVVKPVAAPAPVASTPAVATAPAPASTSAMRMTLPDYLSISALPRASRIQREGMPALIVDVERDCYYGGATLKPLLGYCQGTISREEWQTVPQAELDALRANNSAAQPLSRLVWVCVLSSSNGHLLEGLNVNGRFKLGRYPQSEREFPKHFRIATVMMRGYATMTEISEGSGASIADVADFINAYATLGIVDSEGSAQPVAEPSSGGVGGLLARLRGLRPGA